MRAIYYLRSIGTAEATAILCEALRKDAVAPPGHSPLMRHEVAYVLGQIRDPVACDVLEKTLADPMDDVMVRHECAEALGAIGAPRSIPLLERLSVLGGDDGACSVEIQQTCEVATDFARWKSRGGEASGEARPGVACACMLSAYSSHDPAPPDPATDGLTTAEVGAILRDTTRPLFERYGAMFSLRNRGGRDAVRELGKALVEDESSALLRHEVAFVLGQMQHPAALDSLAEALRRPAEHSMVRHEAAEALGALEFDDDSVGEGSGDTIHNEVPSATERCRQVLELHCTATHEHDAVVRESCEVALDATDYWSMIANGEISHATEGVGLVGPESGFKGLKTQFEVRKQHFNVRPN